MMKNQQDNDSCKILLPGGRNVDLCTNTGADEFLQTTQCSNIVFTTNIRDANKIRKKSRKRSGKKLNAGEKSRLTNIGFMVSSLAEFSTPELFEDKINSSEIEYWLDHVITELKELTKDPRWQRTGVLENHDAFILNPCVYMFMKDVPVLLAFKKGFFQVLNDFIVACKFPALPCADVAETICLLTSNALCSCMLNEMSTWNAEKVFKKLESCGMLMQFIRCSTVPQLHDLHHFPLSVDRFYSELYSCTMLIKKRFGKGKPCGDVIDAILKGEDGHQKNRPKIIKKLEAIASLAKILQPRTFDEKDSKVRSESLKMCRHCNKSDISAEFQMSLMTCSRCKQAFYCSRECQIMDWKIHKSQCATRTKSEEKTFNASLEVASNFVKRYYQNIMKKIVEVCDKTGLTKSDLLLELDFSLDANGFAPALRDPPEFKIKETRRYFEGPRPNLPDWFHKNERNIKGSISCLKENFEKMTENHLLCFVHHTGRAACYRIQCRTGGDNGTHMFSEVALDSFRSAIHYKDFDKLTKIFKDASHMKARLESLKQTEQKLEKG